MSVHCEANSTRAGNWAPFCGFPNAEEGDWGSCDTSQNGNPVRIVGRNNFLFAAGMIAVIAGLLFPLSAHILDVLLIFSVSLAAAVLIITFSARAALEVPGFPLLIVLSTTLRIALSVACSRLILTQNDAGTIIGFLGDVFVRNNCVLANLVFGVLAMLVFVVVCKAAKGISRTAADFAADIVPVRQIGIDGDLNAGVISESRAFDLREKIVREAGFFVAMGGVARFIVCAATIELVIVIVNIVGGMAVGVMALTDTGTSVTGSHFATYCETGPLKTYATLAIGAGLMAQIPALLTVLASRYLVQKSSMPVADEGFVERDLPGVVGDASCEEELDAQQYAVHKRHFDSELVEIINPVINIGLEAEEMVSEELEWFDEPQEGGGDEKDELNLWVWEEIKDDNDYEAIVELIESKSGVEAKTILMAAESVEELGVTVPVNVAMRLAQREKKCLLIDLDLERDAVLKVFDIDSAEPDDGVQPEAISTGTPTCVNNLWVWPASCGAGIGKDDVMSLREVITDPGSRYDFLIIYAPKVSVLTSADWEQIVGCVRAAMLFGDSDSGDEAKGGFIKDFHKLLKNCGCAVFEPAEVFAEAC